MSTYTDKNIPCRVFEDPPVSETWALHAYTVSYSPSFRNYLNDGDESMGTSNSVRWRGKIVSKLRACCSSSASGCNNLSFLSFPTVSFSSKTYCHCFEGKQWTDAKHKPIRWWSTALSRLLTKFEGEKSSLLYACEHDLFTIAPWLPLAEMDAGSVCDSIMRSVDTVRWRDGCLWENVRCYCCFCLPRRPHATRQTLHGDFIGEQTLT